MNRFAKIGPYMVRFLELRLRAFVYALFALVGFQLGLIVHQKMAEAAIAELTDGIKAAVLRKHGQ